MGAQVLSPRSTRRIARPTGLDVVRAWSWGGYTMAFVTVDSLEEFLDRTGVYLAPGAVVVPWEEFVRVAGRLRLRGLDLE